MQDMLEFAGQQEIRETDYSSEELSEFALHSLSETIRAFTTIERSLAIQREILL